MRPRTLLICGIVSSVLYVATDILASVRYEGYRYAEQQISELMAAGAPTRPLLVVLFTLYNALVAAFAVGVWASVGERRAGRITGAMLVGYALAGQATLLFFPMSMRGALAAGEGGLPNSLHIIGTAVLSLFIVLAMGFGATLLGGRFRSYSYGTILTLVVFGMLASLQAGRMVANEPTPWMGLAERVNIYATMLWVAVLAIGLMREGVSARRLLGHPPVIPQPVAR